MFTVLLTISVQKKKEIIKEIGYQLETVWKLSFWAVVRSGTRYEQLRKAILCGPRNHIIHRGEQVDVNRIAVISVDSAEPDNGTKVLASFGKVSIILFSTYCYGRPTKSL